jgi:hypothetical protein
MVNKTKDLIVKVPLAKLGKWWNAAYGLISFTREDFDNIISNVKNNILGHAPYLTFGHLDEEHDSTDSHRKRGDLVDITVIDDTLTGFFKVKPLTYRFVKEGEYEFSSVEYQPEGFNKDTKESVGKLLKRVGLTNSPFVPLNTKAVALSSGINTTAKDRFCVVSKIATQETSANLNLNGYNLNQVNNQISNINMDPKITTTSDEFSNEELTLGLDSEAINSLAATIEKKLEATYKNHIADTEVKLSELTQANTALREELSKSRAVARKRAAEIEATTKVINSKVHQNVTEHLFGIGMPKPLVNKAISILKAHTKGANTVSLSNDAGKTEDFSFTEAFCSLLEELQGTKTVDLSMSGSLTPEYNSANGFQGGYIQDMIRQLQSKHKA